jgi:hypothetical protein
MRNAKLVTALALALTLAMQAQAKLVGAVEPARAAVAPEDLAISTGPIGVALERDYFSAPQATLIRGRAFPCRLQQTIFDKTRLAQFCN